MKLLYFYKLNLKRAMLTVGIVRRVLDKISINYIFIL